MSVPNLLNPRGEYQDIYEQAFRFSRERLHPLMARMDDEDWYPPHLMKELAEAGYQLKLFLHDDEYYRLPSSA